MLKFIQSIKLTREKAELLMRKTEELDRRIKRLELEEYESCRNKMEAFKEKKAGKELYGIDIELIANKNLDIKDWRQKDE